MIQLSMGEVRILNLLVTLKCGVFFMLLHRNWNRPWADGPGGWVLTDMTLISRQVKAVTHCIQKDISYSDRFPSFIREHGSIRGLPVSLV